MISLSTFHFIFFLAFGSMYQYCEIGLHNEDENILVLDKKDFDGVHFSQ